MSNSQQELISHYFDNEVQSHETPSSDELVCKLPKDPSSLETFILGDVYSREYNETHLAAAVQFNSCYFFDQPDKQDPSELQLEITETIHHLAAEGLILLDEQGYILPRKDRLGLFIRRQLTLIFGAIM